MPDDAALLQTIIEQPDDDAPRLIYADWLEEQGDTERAEFIRVQIDLARLSEDDPRRPEQDRRERTLRKAHFEDWIAPLRSLAPFHKARSEYRRGFVEFVSVTRAGEFLEGADLLFRQAPIRRLSLHLHDSSLLPRLGSARWLAGLKQLRLQAWECEEEPLVSFVAAPFLPEQIELDLGGDLGIKAATTLARPEVQARFRVLDLVMCLMPTAAEALLRARFGERVLLPAPEQRERLETRRRIMQHHAALRASSPEALS